MAASTASLHFPRSALVHYGATFWLFNEAGNWVIDRKIVLVLQASHPLALALHLSVKCEPDSFASPILV